MMLNIKITKIHENVLRYLPVGGIIGLIEKIIGPMNEIDDTGGFSLGPVTMYTQLTQ